jgi:hypothetical protein
MKVPQYKEKIARSNAGGGVFLTAQANPNAWGAMGTALSDVGDTVYNLGLEKYKIQAQADVNETMPIFAATIDSIKEKHKNSRNPLQAEIKIKNEMTKAYKDFSSGSIKNGAGQAYLSSSLSKSAFGTKASSLVTAGILAWKKQNNAYIVEVDKINETNELNNHTKTASNISTALEERELALNKIFSTNKNFNSSNPISAFNNTGKIDYFIKSNKFSASEIAKQQEKVVENIVLGVSTSLVGSNKYRPKMVTEAIRQSIKNPDILKNIDPILAKVWENLNGEQKDSLLDKIRNMENDYKKDLKDKKAEDVAASTAANDKIYNSIVNVDENNAVALTKAKENFAALKVDGYFEKPSDRDAIQDMLYPDEESKTRTTDPDEAEKLEILAQNNLLTKDKIDAVKLKLSNDDRKYWIRQLAVERTQASDYVEKNLINAPFGIDKLSSADVGFKNTLNQLRLAATSEFNAWRIKNGLAATFAEVEAKGAEVMIPYTAKITALYKATFDIKINAFKNVYKTQFEALEKPYTLMNVLTFLTNEQAKNIANNSGKVDGRLLQWQKDFQKYDGVIGAESWNN